VAGADSNAIARSVAAVRSNWSGRLEKNEREDGRAVRNSRLCPRLCRHVIRWPAVGFFRAAMAALLAAAFALAPAMAVAAPAAEPFEINVIIPLTGGGAFLGSIEKVNFEAHQTSINRSGGIQGRPVAFVFHDDQSSPQHAVQIIQQILPSQPAIVIGPTLQAMCNAIAPLMAKGPVLFCLSNSFKPLPGGYSFSSGNSTPDMAEVLIRYFRLKGLTRIAVMTSIDATGQSADQAIDQILARPENAGIKKVEHQHFNLSDVSVAAQMQRIDASEAQALLAWTTGSALATIFKAMIQAGVDIPVGTTAGNQLFSQMEQYDAFLPKQVLFGSALYPPHDGIITLDPRVEAAQQEMYKTLQEHNVRVDVGTGTIWDTASIVVEGLRKLGPRATAEQLRDYIATLTDFAGIEGIYDFKTYPDRGSGPASSTVVSYDRIGKRWVWLSKPGGEPLAQ
jgi:branched-chain amino acid transport system substrate-binding protein